MIYSILALGIAVNFYFGQCIQVLDKPQDADLEIFPYQAHIIATDMAECSAIIIDKYYLLTAASCIADVSGVEVFVGTKSYPSYFNRIILNTQMYKSSKLIIYGDDDDTGAEYFKYDIGLIKLSRPIQFSATVQAANIQWEPVSPEPNSILRISGWHQFKNQQLQYMTARLAPQDKCDLCYNAGNTGKIILCLEFTGSEYLDFVGNIAELNGRVFGYLVPGLNGGTCSKLLPFVNISAFTNWISKKTNINFVSKPDKKDIENIKLLSELQKKLENLERELEKFKKESETMSNNIKSDVNKSLDYCNRRLSNVEIKIEKLEYDKEMLLNNFRLISDKTKTFADKVQTKKLLYDVRTELKSEINSLADLFQNKFDSCTCYDEQKIKQLIENALNELKHNLVTPN